MIIDFPIFTDLTPEKFFDYAIQSHNNEIAKYILKNYKTKTNDSGALKYSNFEFIEDFYHSFDKGDSSFLLKLLECDLPKFAKIFINEKKIDINQLEYEFNIDKYSISPKSDKQLIVFKAIKSCREILNYLIDEKGVKIEFDNKILVEAIKSEDFNLLKMILCQSNIDINSIINKSFYIGNEYCNCFIPLFLAITKQNIKIVELLLKYPSFDVNVSINPNDDAYEKSKITALHLAILYENIPIIKLLLNQRNIDVNFIAHFDSLTYKFHNWSSYKYFDQFFSPLHEAIELNNMEIVKLLLNHPNLSVNEIGVYDTYRHPDKPKFQRVEQTALCRAVQMKNIDIVRLLLMHNDIDVNKQAVLYCEVSNPRFDGNYIFNEGEGKIIRRTPLQFAYASKSQEIIQLLLSRSDIQKIEDNETDNKNEEEKTLAFSQNIGWPKRSPS